jgi:hypothetical protein
MSVEILHRRFIGECARLVPGRTRQGDGHQRGGRVADRAPSVLAADADAPRPLDELEDDVLSLVAGADPVQEPRRARAALGWTSATSPSIRSASRARTYSSSRA